MGKTLELRDTFDSNEKHPHVRGEDLLIAMVTSDVKETPPRAWGRLVQYGAAVGLNGNTPTCVGKTHSMLWSLKFSQKHPHVRGEDCGF